MRSKWWRGAVAALTLFATWGLVAPATQGGEPKVGEMAPDFALVGTDGKTHKLSDYVGKQAIVIAWYPKAKTGGWTRECKSLGSSGALLKKFNVAYFGASCDEPAYNKEFATELGISYPLLSDPTRKTALAYGLVENDKGLPKRWTIFIGKDGKLLHIDKAVKVDSHGEDIAAKLKELGVEEAK